MTHNKKEKRRLRQLAAKSGMTYQAALQQSAVHGTPVPRQIMRLRTVFLSNFRGFRELELELAPFTVVIGPNAAGKSSLLAAVHLLARSLDLHSLTVAPGASIDVSRIFAGETGIGRDFRMSAELDGNYATRAALSVFGVGDRPRVELRLSPAISPTRVMQPADPPRLSTSLIPHLGDVEGSYRDVLWNWLSDLPGDSINAINHNLFELAGARVVAPRLGNAPGDAKKIYFERGGVRRELAQANSSLIALLWLWAGIENCLAAEGQSLLLFDEPEIHLHPTLQAEVASRIAHRLGEKSARAIMVTHSPEVCARLLPLPDTSALAFAAPLVSPRRIHTLDERADKFEFKEKLGSGAFADVYAATDHLLRRQVAIKLFKPGGTNISSAVDHAQALARIRHNNVVTIYEVTKLPHPVDHEYRSAIVMEYLGGPNLAEVLSGPPLARARAVALCAGIIAGLEALHDEGIVHHDLHDENIRLDARGVPKILDVLYRGTLTRLPEADRKGRIQQDVAVAASLLGQILVHSLHADTALRFRRFAAGATCMDEIARALDRALGEDAVPDPGAPLNEADGPQPPGRG